MSTFFPMFVELSGCQCLVVGASSAAETKIQSLLASGASVRVVSPHGTAQIETWARTRKISWKKRQFHSEDLKSMAFVLAATTLRKTNELIAAKARKRGILCSIAEPLQRFDFYLLLELLPQVQDPYVKETLVKALSVPKARPFAAPVLVEEFRKAESSQMLLKSAISCALSVVADDAVCDDILALAQEQKHGESRQMIVLTLGNMNDSRAVEIAMKLLEDQAVAGHAIMALGRLKASCARSSIAPFLQHHRAWIRKEAKKALQRIDGFVIPFGAMRLEERGGAKRRSGTFSLTEKPLSKYKKRA